MSDERAGAGVKAAAAMDAGAGATGVAEAASGAEVSRAAGSGEAAGAEQRLYLLGHPVSHSKSPAMYNAVYERLGLPWRYDLKDCATEDDARSFLDARDFLSINITTPYKPHAYAAATARAASAKLARGANLLVCKGGALLAYNTDGQGCVAALKQAGTRLTGAHVVVCGTGPTALSIVHALAMAGAAEIVLVGRDKDRSRAVLERYVRAFGDLAHATVDLPAAEGERSFRAAYEETNFKFGSYTTSTQAIAAADVVVDATSLGMRPDDPAPFDTALFRAGQVAFDVVYGHGETAFLRGARAAGARAFDGAGMLVGQAVITTQTVCDIAGVSMDAVFPAFDDLFSFMADAAGFTLP